MREENIIPIFPRPESTYLRSLRCPDSKGEKGGFLPITRHFELGEGGSVALDGLADLSFDGVELHVACHTMLLSRDANQKEPLESLVRSVVDDLATC